MDEQDRFLIAQIVTVLIALSTGIPGLLSLYRQRKRDEQDNKEQEANAADINVKTTLALLPPLKIRIKELEAQVAELEREVAELEGEVGKLTAEKVALQQNIMRLEAEIQSTKEEKIKVDTAYQKACDEVKNIYAELVKIKKEKGDKA